MSDFWSGVEAGELVAAKRDPAATTAKPAAAAPEP